MQKELLKLKPRRFLCPYCGEWHEWDALHEIGYYDSHARRAWFKCTEIPSECDNGNYSIYFHNDTLYCLVDSVCNRACLEINEIIPISSIHEQPDAYSVLFNVEFTSAASVGVFECRNCVFKTKCNCVKLGNCGNRHMSITLGFEFEENEYLDALRLARKRESQECEQYLITEEQEWKDEPEHLLEEHGFVLKSEKQDVQQYSSEEIMEEPAMSKNNIFNMNLEFGPNTDNNITSTLMGIAVKSNSNTWRIYDKKKKEIIDIGDVPLGTFPIFVMPTAKLEEGDLIKDVSGEYYFVMNVGTSIEALSLKNGEVKNVLPIKNVMGLSCYSKVIAFIDKLGNGNSGVLDTLLMSVMCGMSGDAAIQMNQMIPLMLFKEKLGSDDDVMKMMLMSSMMGGQPGDGAIQMNQMIPLMLFKEKLGGNDDVMKMMLMSSMMGGQSGDGVTQMNPLIPLMLMKEKPVQEEKPVQDTPQIII